MRLEKIYAIIPAWSGSKGVPKKNIRLLGGHPLIAYSIVAARRCRHIDRVIVSTDSPEIADISGAYGAEAPFLRPAELARDSSTDVEFIRHALDWFQDHEHLQPELLVHLRPTTPLRESALIDSAIDLIASHDEATSLRSAHQVAEPPEKMFRVEDGFLTGLFPPTTRGRTTTICRVRPFRPPIIRTAMSTSSRPTLFAGATASTARGFLAS